METLSPPSASTHMENTTCKQQRMHKNFPSLLFADARRLFRFVRSDDCQCSYGNAHGLYAVQFYFYAISLVNENHLSPVHTKHCSGGMHILLYVLLENSNNIFHIMIICHCQQFRCVCDYAFGTMIIQFIVNCMFVCAYEREKRKKIELERGCSIIP